jgi:hypothetical protein
MIRASHILTGVCVVLMVDAGVHSASADFRSDLSDAYRAEGTAKSAIDTEKAIGDAQSRQKAQTDFDKAVENTESKLDDYVKDHGTIGDKIASDDLAKATKNAQDDFNKVYQKSGLTQKDIDDAKKVEDAVIENAKIKFRKNTKATRDKIRAMLKNREYIPDTLEVSYQPGLQTGVPPGTQTALASVQGVPAEVANPVTPVTGEAIQAAGALPNFPGLTFTFDSTKDCTHHPTIPMYIPLGGGPTYGPGTNGPGPYGPNNPGGNPTPVTPGTATPLSYTPATGNNWSGYGGWMTPGPGRSVTPHGGVGLYPGWENWGDPKISVTPGDTPRTTDRGQPKKPDNTPTTPPPILINVKATSTAIQTGQNAVQLPGQQIKLIPSMTLDTDLPGTNAKRDTETGHGEDPVQATTGGKDNTATLMIPGVSDGYKMTFGARGDLAWGWSYDISAQYGHTTATSLLLNDAQHNTPANSGTQSLLVDGMTYQSFWLPQDQAQNFLGSGLYEVNWCRGKLPASKRRLAKVDARRALPGMTIHIAGRMVHEGSHT